MLRNTNYYPLSKDQQGVTLFEKLMIDVFSKLIITKFDQINALHITDDEKVERLRASATYAISCALVLEQEYQKFNEKK